MFWYSQEKDLAVALIPKAGITSIREWLGPGFTEVSNDAARAASRRVAFIRNPVERLISCYSFMYWLNDYGRPHRSGVPVSSWEAFVDHILTHDDEHWIPQTILVGDVPNIYRRFENLSQQYEEFRPGIVPHWNAVTHLPTNDYRRPELLVKYQDDISLWQSL